MNPLLRAKLDPPPQFKCPHCKLWSGYKFTCEVCGRDMTQPPKAKEEKK